MRFRPRSALATGVLVLALLSGLTAFVTYPQVRDLSTGVNDPGDPLLNAWALAWVAHQLPIAPGHIFDANIFHPERRTLAYSEILIVPGLMAAPLLWSGAGPIFSYNVVFLSGFVLSGFTTFLLVRSLTGRTGAALVAGVFFLLQPFRLDHYPHLQMQMTQFMPLALWSLHRTLEQGRWRDGILTGVWLAFTGLSCMYYGVFFGPYLAVVCAVLMCRSRPSSRTLAALVAGALVCAALVQPAARAYLRNQTEVGQRSADEALTGSAELRNYLASRDTSALYGWTSERFGKSEARLFPGLLVVAFAILGAWPPMTRVKAAYLVALLFAFDLSRGFNGFVYPLLYQVVVPFRALRVPARAGILVGMTLSVLAGFGFARASLRCSRAGRLALLAVVIAGAVAEYTPSRVTLFHVWRTMPSFYDWLKAEPEGPVVEFPVDSYDPIYMYFSTRHWHPLLNGYSGFFPRSYMRLRERVAAFPDRGSIEYLQMRGARFVVLHGKFYEPDEFQSVVERLAGLRELELVSRVVWEGSDERLYRLRVPE